MRFNIASERFELAGLFYGHGRDNALDEAVDLLLFSLNLPSDSSNELLSQPLTTAQWADYQQLFNQRIEQRIPAAYIIGKAVFAGMEFMVDPRVLVPRSPLAELIEQQFMPWYAPGEIRQVLEIGTGSGCIAIACATYLPEATVDAIDIDPEALKVARSNVGAHQLTERVKLLQSDCFDAVPAKKYDLIISNPPYVDGEDMANLPAEYLHEPQHGLAAGEDGLAIVRTILAKARQYLSDDGLLMVEVGNSQEALMAAYPQLAFYLVGI